MVYTAVAVVLLTPAWWMAIIAETLSGHLAGIVPCALAALPPLFILARRNRRMRRVAASASALTVALGVWLLALSPTGEAISAGAPRNRFLNNGRFERWNLPNVVPEIDQIKFGTDVVAPVDPFIDVAQARRLREAAMGIYLPMQADPDYRTLGSVMGAAYEDRDIGHVYEYVPPHAEGERLPALVFLHGSAGNFKAYFYLWRAVADRARVILLCPSFGFGNWNQPGGMEAIDRAVRHAVETLQADPNKILLAGLSNGGRGVTRAVALHPERYAGVLFVSAVMESAILSAPPLPGGYLHRPVLVIHGDADRRIPIDHARHAVEVMRTRDADVTAHVYEGEDHFLLFTRVADVQEEVASWIERVK